MAYKTVNGAELFYEDDGAGSRWSCCTAGVPAAASGAGRSRIWSGTTGHMAQQDQPGRFNRALRAALRRMSPAAAVR